MSVDVPDGFAKTLYFDRTFEYEAAKLLPGEFYVTGSLRDWDVSDRLGEIRQPTLVIGGRFDEATPTITEALHRGILGSEWVVLEECSHLCHLEEPHAYRRLLGAFLQRVEDCQADG